MPLILSYHQKIKKKKIQTKESSPTTIQQNHQSKSKYIPPFILTPLQVYILPFLCILSGLLLSFPLSLSRYISSLSFASNMHPHEHTQQVQKVEFTTKKKTMRKPCCDKESINKGAWSKQEDQKLIDYIRVHGEGCWRSIPKAAG